MFERFTDRARRVLVMAQEISKELGHTRVGTEHLLLALLQENTGVAAFALRRAGLHLDHLRGVVASRLPPQPTLGDAAPALAAVGIDLAAVRTEIDKTFGDGALQLAPTGAPPFTPNAKDTLKTALQTAVDLENDYVGTEHLLLGLLSLDRGLARDLLAELNIEPAVLAEEAKHILRRLLAIPAHPTRDDRNRLARGVAHLPDAERSAAHAALAKYDSAQADIAEAALDLDEASLDDDIAALQDRLGPTLAAIREDLRAMGVLDFVELAGDLATSDEVHHVSQAIIELSQPLASPETDPVEAGRRRRHLQDAQALLRSTWLEVWNHHTTQSRADLAARFDSAEQQIRRLAADIERPESA